MANSPDFENLPSWLVLSLPLYRALEKLGGVEQPGVVVTVLHRGLNWVTIRWVVQGRKVNVEVKPRRRQGTLMWSLSRVVDSPDSSSSKPPPPEQNDEFQKVLVEKVWNEKGNGWKGLTTGAAASLEGGVEEIVGLVDEVVRGVAVGGPQQQLPHHQGAPPQPTPQQQFQQAQAARFQQQMQQRQQQQMQPAANMTGGPPPPQPVIPQANMMNRGASGQGQQGRQGGTNQQGGYGSSMANALVLD
ncbi:uncharacterized protein PODANS_1_9560 [Podospora anserina S mat+]|nr:uncharacterized protein PODANS_1_9560 [Podospora anserina S mat+]CAP69290.1 unnamed protein product [Podospora anserina S mat+]